MVCFDNPFLSVSFRPGENNVGQDMTGYSQYYDFTHSDTFIDINSIGYLTKYLNSPETKQAIHAGALSYSFSNATVGKHLAEDFMQSVGHNLTELIGEYKILLFTGNFDIMVGVTSVNGFLENRGLVLSKLLIIF